MKIQAPILSFAILLAASCGGEGEEQYVFLENTHSWEGIELPSLSESDTNCISWTLNNEEDIFVNAVTMSNGGGLHHSNWYFVKDHMFEGPDGYWPCEERGMDQLTAILGGGVVAAQSTQARAETQGFAEGAAYMIPAHARIVANLHTLNATDAPLITGATLELHTIPPDEVTTRLSPMMLSYERLEIPPHESSSFTMNCDFEKANGAPLDFNFYYMLPHYHELGRGVRLEGVSATGGTSMIYERYSEIGEVLSATLEPTVSTQGMKDLRFGCDFVNPRDEVVGSGIGDQEMCIMVAWQDSPYMWVGLADKENIDLGVDENGVHRFESSNCAVGFFQNQKY